MKRSYILFVASLFVSGLVIYVLAKFLRVDLSTMYFDKIRPYLFTGFLTIGGFLLSLKIFILISLKEKLYDSEGYKKIYFAKKALRNDIVFYGSLINLGNLLVLCVGLSLITAFLQISLGLFQKDITSIVCMSFAYATLVLIFFALVQIRGSLKIWFNYLEKITPEIQDKTKEQLKLS